jgi:formylglycine-generating enzyme required for sulfatase activity
MTTGKKEFIPDMVLIAAGDFLMGSEEGMDNEKPVHRVWVEGFMMGKFPVTNKEYKCFVDKTGAVAPPFWSEKTFAHAEKPVVGVNWHDAVAYCVWLSRRSGKKLRLPTEAEWERAARGGIEGRKYPWGDELPSEHASPGYDLESGGPERVGLHEPNGFGLYDMCASVHEWCNDFYDPNYYWMSPDRNPPGASSGQRMVSRGGSWRHRIKFSRCAARSSLNPALRYADYGFRLAIDVR